MTDIGTGTSMRNIVHESTGIPIHKIKIDLGISDLPPAPSQGGNHRFSSISEAATANVDAMKLEFI